MHDSGTLEIVGVYGSGKVLVADEISTFATEHGSVVVRVSFKDMAAPTHSDALRVFGREVARQSGHKEVTSLDTDFALHYLLHETIRLLSSARIVMLIEEAQLLSSMPDSFWDAIESVRYRNGTRLSVICLGQPQLRDMSSAGYRRLMIGDIVYIGNVPKRAMHAVVAMEEKRLGVDFSRFRDQLYRLSGGHYGTIKYMTQLLKKHAYTGMRLTSSWILEHAQKETNFLYFLRMVWDSLRDEERLLLQEYLESGSIRHAAQLSDSYMHIAALGLLRKHGERIVLSVPMYRESIRRIIRMRSDRVRMKAAPPLTLANTSIMIFGNNADSAFTYQEKRVLTVLLERQGSIVPYEDMAIALWGKHSEQFSLWTIAKVVQRLRTKMRRLGVDPRMLRNASKAGYTIGGISQI